MKSLTSAMPTENERGRLSAREENRRRNAEDAKAQSKRRAAMTKKTVSQRVGDLKLRIASQNVAGACELIELASPGERPYWLLAEETGLNRKTVLNQFPGQVPRAVREAYDREVGQASPDQPLGAEE